MTISSRSASGSLFEARVGEVIEFFRMKNGERTAINAATLGRMRGPERETFHDVISRAFEVRCQGAA